MNLKYIIDRKYDARMIYEMILAQNKDKNGLKYQSKIMKLPLESVTEISNAKSYVEIMPVILDLVSKRYADDKSRFKKKVQYQKSWNEINDKFFNRLIEITKYRCDHKVFYCVLSAFHHGISNWGGNTIVRSWKEDKDKQRRITAHEIIISHFFSYIRAKYTNKKDENEIWEIAEIFAFALTGTDEIMKNFWPWESHDSFTDHNYPDIVERQQVLTKLFNDLGFEGFVRKSF